MDNCGRKYRRWICYDLVRDSAADGQASRHRDIVPRAGEKLHPDVNRNDRHAVAFFAELNAAHEILSDGVNHDAFDRGEIAAEGRPPRQLPACDALVPLRAW